MILARRGSPFAILDSGWVLKSFPADTKRHRPTASRGQQNPGQEVDPRDKFLSDFGKLDLRHRIDLPNLDGGFRPAEMRSAKKPEDDAEGGDGKGKKSEFRAHDAGL